jgi:hypothetical protein
MVKTETKDFDSSEMTMNSTIDKLARKRPSHPILLGDTPSRRRSVTPRRPLMTCDGKPRRRLTESDLLRALSSELGAATLSRLDTYMQIFCECVGDGACTRVGQGPRSWRKHRGLITQREVCLHLLGARFAATHPPRWLAARSFPTAWHSCFDLDAALTPEQRLSRDYDFSSFAGTPDELAEIKAEIIREHPSWSRPKPPLEERFGFLKDRLKLLAIDLDNPRHALILDTPSGGFHIFTFWDKPFALYQPRLLWEAIGLRHLPGQLELFPSTTRALRLPFGHIPQKPDDPDRWQQFVDDYDNGRIRRFNVLECYEALNRNQARLQVLAQAQQPSFPSSPAVSSFSHPGRPLTRSERSDLEWYDDFLSRPVRNRGEIDRLLETGILLYGSRWEVVKRLCWHYIHVRRLDEERAVAEIRAWLDDARHRSEDVENARASGNWSQLERDLRSIVRGQLRNRHRNEASAADHSHDDGHPFAPAELAVIHDAISVVPEPDRPAQAHFFLHALRYAKVHGTPLPDHSGYLLAPAINAVVKKWKYCYQKLYQTRFDYAEKSGIWSLAREKWQRPGGAGRCRTYRLLIPVLCPRPGLLTYDQAHALLVSGNMPSSPASPSPGSSQPQTEECTEPNADSLPPIVSPTTDAAAAPAPGAPPPDPWAVYFGQPDKIRLLNEKLAQLLLSDPAVGLTTKQRRILTVPGEQLSRDEVQERVGLLKRHRKRYLSRITL